MFKNNDTKAYINMRKNQSGFTLIEVAVIITILGLIIAPFFNYLANTEKKKRFIKDERKAERITAALSAYVAVNQRFPCPANAAGVERRAGANCSVNNGFLPTQVLGLSVEDSLNQHHWRFLYTVSPNVVADGSSAANGNLTVNAFGTNITQLPYVIVDPGKDGKGSISALGAASFAGACATGNNNGDQDNCDNDRNFLERRQNTTVSPRDPTYYDDKLMYNLVRKDSTHWQVTMDADADGDLDTRASIHTRGDGNLGIGFASGDAPPEERLHIKDGNINITPENAGGTAIKATGSVNVNNNVKAKSITADTIHASDGFYYCDGDC